MSKRTQKKNARSGKNKEPETPMAQKKPTKTTPKLYEEDYDSGDDYYESEEENAYPFRKRSHSTIGMDSKGRTQARGQRTPTVSLTSKQVETVTPYKTEASETWGKLYRKSVDRHNLRDIDRSEDMVRKNLEKELLSCSKAYSELPPTNM